MTSKRNVMRILVLAAIAAMFVFPAGEARAATVYWDIVPGTVGGGDSLITGGDGTWDLTNGNWTADGGATNVAWVNGNNDTAVFGGTAGTVTLGAPVTVGGLTFDTANYVIQGTDANTLTFGVSGAITANADATISAVIAGGGTETITKLGAGTLTLTGANTYTGATNVNAGTLVLSGAGGAIASSSGISLNRGAVLTLDNSVASGGNNTGRIGSSAGLTVTTGGTMNFAHDAEASTSYSQTLGAVTLNPGSFNLNTSQAAEGQTSVLTLGSIARSAGGTVLFSGTGFGADDRNAVKVTTALTNSNGILPWALVKDGSTYDLAVGGAAGEAVTKYSGYELGTNANTVWTGTSVNARPSATTETLSATRTVNSLVLDDGVNVGGGSGSDRTLNVGSGGFGTIVQTGGTSTIQRNGNYEITLAFGTNEAIFNIIGTLIHQRQDKTSLTGSGGVTKTGPGTLTLGDTGNTDFRVANTGTLRLNEGLFELFTNNAAGLSTPSIHFNGGNLTLHTGQNLSFNRAVTLTADATITADRAGSPVAGVTSTFTTLAVGNQTLTVAGGPSVNSGTAGITFSGATTLSGSPTFNVTNPAAGGGTTLTLTGAVSGGGYALTKTGDGTLVLAGSNTYTGGTTVSGGTLVAASAASLPGYNDSAKVSIAAGATLAAKVGGAGWDSGQLDTLKDLGAASWAAGSILGIDTTNGDFAYGSAIGDAGANARGLIKLGANTLSLDVANTYTGGTTVSAGALTFLNTSAKPATGTVDVAAGATLGLGVGGEGYFSSTDVDNLFAGNFVGNLANVTHTATSNVGIDTTAEDLVYASSVPATTRGLFKFGAGTLTLSGSNAYTGATTVNGGTLKITGTVASAVTVNGGTLNLSNPNAVQNSTVTMSGGGSSLVFDSSVGGNAFTLGGLAASAAGAGYDIALENNDVSPAAVALTVGGNNAGTTYAGVLSGAGSLIKVGTGTTTLQGANTYTGTTTVSAGTLTANNAGTVSGSSSITLDGGRLLLDNATNNVNNNRIKDTAPITLSMGGELNLTGSNANWTETVGDLALAGGNSIVTVKEGTASRIATLAGGAFSRSAGATALVRGTSLGQNATQMGKITLTDTGGVTLVGTATLNNAANADATKTVKIVPYLLGGSTDGDGGSTFITYDTTLGFRALSVANQFVVLSAGYATPTDHENVRAFNGTITAADPSVNSLLFNNSSTGETINGSGTLTVDSGAIALVVNKACSIGAGFDGVTLGNGTWNEGVITVTQNTLTINPAISVTGGGGLTKAGANTLVLSGVNTYTGATTVNAGTLTIGGAGQLNSGDYAGNIAIVSGLLNYNSTAAQTLSGVISGAGALTKANTGTLIVSGTNTYTGTTTVSGGVLRANDNVGLPGTGSTGGGSYLNLAGGVFETGANLERSGTGTAAGNMRITSGTSGFSAYGAPVQVAFGTIASPDALTWGTAPFQPGTFILNAATANNTIEFKNAIDLNTGTGGVTRTVQVDAATATMSGNLTQSGTGAANFTKTGAGTLVLSGTNTYAGTTTVSAGKLIIGVANALPSVPVTVNGTLDMNGLDQQIRYLSGSGSVINSGGSQSVLTLNMLNSGKPTFSGAIDGNIRLVVQNATTLTNDADVQTLSGTNTYTGGTVIDHGHLRVADESKLGAAPASFDPANITLINGGHFQNNNSNLVLSANRGIYLGSRVGDPETGGELYAGWGKSITVYGAVSGPGNLGKADSGTLYLYGVNTYTGDTTVSDGTLEIAGAGQLGSGNYAGLISIASGKTFRYNSSANQTLSGVVSGDGALTLTGAGTLTLSGANTYSGTTTISAGTLTILGTNDSTTGATTLTAGTLQLGNASNGGLAGGTLTFGNATAGAAVIQAVGDDRVITNNTVLNNTYGTVSGSRSLEISGTFTNSGGSRTLTNDLDSGKTLTLSGTVNLTDNTNNNRTLTIAGNGYTVITGPMVNNNAAYPAKVGSLTKSGAGTLAVAGTNTYTGATTVNAGTLLLDANAGGSLDAASGLTLGGGSFSVLGKAAGATAQTLGGLTLTKYTASKIVLNPNDGDSTTLTLDNAWSRGNGASLLIDYSSANAGTRQVVTAGDTTGYALTNGIYNGILVKDSAGVTGFATRAAGTDQAITRYDDAGLATTLAAGSNDAATNFTTLGTTYSGGTLDWTDGGALTARSVNTLTIDTTLNGGIIDMGAATNILTLGSSILFKGPNDATLTGGGVWGIRGSTGGAGGGEMFIHATGTGTLTIDSPLLRGDPWAYYGGGGWVVKDGDGEVVLTGASNYGVPSNSHYGSGVTAVNAGILRAGVASVKNTSGAFGLNCPVVLANVAGATLDLDGFDNTIGSLSGGGSLGGNVTLGDAALTVGGMKPDQDKLGDSIYAGVISSSGNPTTSLIIRAGGIGDIGTQIFTGVNTYTGATIVAGGELTLAGTAGSLAGTGAVTVTGGAALIDGDSTVANNNGVNDRINPLAPLTLGGDAWDDVSGAAWGGTFSLYRPAAANTISQSFPRLTVEAGASTIRNLGTGGTATLNFTDPSNTVYTRNAGGTVNFPTAMTTFANAPSSSISAGTGDTILIGAFLNNADFVKAGAGDVTAVTAYDTQDDPANWGTAAGHDGIIAGAAISGTTSPGAVSIQALKSTGAGTLAIGTGDANSLSIASGMILHTPANSLTINGPGSLTSGNGQDLVLNVASGSGTVTVNAPITGSIGLTKAGSGTLSLTSPASDFSGNIYLQGTLDFNPTGPFTFANSIVGSGAITKNGAATLNLTGTVNIGGGFTVNADAGTVNLTGATDIGGNVIVNTGGTLNLTGPSAAISGAVTVNAGAALQWSNARSLAYYNPQGGTTGSAVTVGSAGATRAVASISVPPGSTLGLGNGRVGQDGTGNGGSPAGHELTISGGGTVLLRGNTSFYTGGSGAAGGGTGTLNISGEGTLVHSTGWSASFEFGYPNSIGYFNLSDGATVDAGAQARRTTNFGKGGSAIAYQSGGLYKFSTFGIGASGATAAGAVCSYTLTGGNLTAWETGDIGVLNEGTARSATVGSTNTGTLSVLGAGRYLGGDILLGGTGIGGSKGTLNVAAGGSASVIGLGGSVALGNANYAIGVVNIKDAELALNGGISGGGAQIGKQGTINLSGATIKYLRNASDIPDSNPENPNKTWMGGFTHAYIYSGGLTVDTQAYTGEFSQALEAATGTGVAGVTLIDGGAGYTAAPIVSFTGGSVIDDNNAEAIATFDRDTGKVTGIVIVNPGQYTTPPTGVTLSRVAGDLDTWDTAATVSIGSIISNAGGGLTKAGTGTLTLTEVNTYNGDTIVQGGILSYGSTGGRLDDASTVNISAGAAMNLDFSGTDTIAELWLGGVKMAPGTYNATNTSTYFTGTGELLVKVGADTNGDGVVDAADFITLKKNFGQTIGGGVTVGDFNDSGTVNWADLNILTSNMGATGGAPAVTPEPCSAMLLVFGAAVLLRRKRK